MRFINPWALIGLIGVPILILIYIIRHRYREEVVPSTFLWKRSLKYMKRRLPFNLKNIILLLLQISAIALAVFVIARPAILSTETGEIIAIIDASSSMSTVDLDGKTRLDRAKAEIVRLAEEADEHNPITIISAGEHASEVLHRSGDRRTIVNSLDTIECEWGAADSAGALEIAERIRRDYNVGARVFYYTDTTYDKVENVEMMMMTDNEWNAAALSLSVEQMSNGAFGFTGSIASYGRDETITAALYVDGNFVQAKKVDCNDGEPTTVAFREYEAVNYSHAEIRLQLPDEGDALVHDNKYLVHQETNPRKRVEVIFNSKYYNEFLPIALSAARINYQVVMIDNVTKDGLEDRRNQTGGFNTPKIKYSGYGAYIFVGILPEELPQDGTTWLMNPPTLTDSLRKELGIEIGEEVSDPEKYGYTLTPALTDESEEEFAILKNLTFVNKNPENENDNTVKVLSYRPILPVKYAEGTDESAKSKYTYKSLLYCEHDGNADTLEDDVFLVGKNKNNHTRVILSSLISSSMMTSMEYPLLISNLITYACPEIFEQGNRIVGETADLTLPAGTIGIEVIRDETTISLLGSREYSNKGSAQLSDTLISFDAPGDYTVRLHIAYVNQSGEVTESKQQDYYSYVALSSTESDSYQNLPELSAVIPQDGKVVIVPVEIWFYLLIALLVVLMAEWLVYHHA